MLLIELDDVFSHLGIHYVERLGGIDGDKIGHVLSLANQRLPSACEVLQGRLPPPLRAKSTSAGASR